MMDDVLSTAAAEGSAVVDELSPLLPAGLIVDRTEDETVVLVKIGGNRDDARGGKVVMGGATIFDAFVINSIILGVSST